MVRRHLRVAHQDPRERALALPLVDARVGSPRRRAVASIRFSIEYAIETFARAACLFVHRVAQHRHRQARVVCLVRDERAERVERDADRHPPVTKCHACERELAGERRALQALQARRAMRPDAERTLIRRLQARLEDAHERLAPRGLDTNRRERVVRRVALVGPVEDLPIAELAATAEADATGADAAERKRDLSQIRPGEHARVGDART